MAGPEKQRLFVGNLPSDTSTNELKELFEKFKVSDVQIKRKNALGREVVFAYVNICPKRVKKCLKTLSGYEWKNQELKIEVAKENFLDRLKKERLQREETKTQEASISDCRTLNNHVPGNTKIKFEVNEDLSENDENFHEASPETNVPRSRNLPMFRGIANVKDYEDEPEVVPKETMFREASPTEECVLNSDIDISMKRFENFSSVWRDDATDDGFVFGNSGLPYESSSGASKSQRKKNSNDRQRTVVTGVSKTESGNEEKFKPDLKNSKYKSEMKRKMALEEKWNSVMEKKNVVRNALKNINLEKDHNRLRKENGLTSYDDEVETGRQNREKFYLFGDSEETPDQCQTKMTLFDDSSGDDASEPNFEVKSYLEGDKGLKRLNLKAKLANDDRFRMDERFFDDEERDKKAKKNSENRPTPGLMKRYDPEQLVQEKTVIPKDKKTKNKKKNLKKAQQEETSEPTQMTKPEVSKEKHYLVSDNLKDAFKGNDEKSSFSLSAMFDAKLGQNGRKRIVEEKSDSTILKKRLKFVENPLENDIQSQEENIDEEDEEPLEVLPLTVPSEKVLGKCGVWGETFFFMPGDSRLKGAASFYQSSKPSEREDFGKRRKQLRSIVKKKIQNSRRDKRVFKRKLGGKIDRSKFKMRLRKIHL